MVEDVILVQLHRGLQRSIERHDAVPIGDFDFIWYPADDITRHLESGTIYFLIVIRLTTPVSFFLQKRTFLRGEISVCHASEKLSNGNGSPIFWSLLPNNPWNTFLS